MTEVHISPAGNDAWSGRSSDTDGQDGPVSTLVRGRDIVREILSSPSHGRITVSVHAGEYRLGETLDFIEKDSGLPEAEVTWQAVQGEKIAVTGSIPIDSIGPAPGPVPAGVLKADFNVNKIPTIPDIEPRGQPPLLLFHNGTELKMSSWPPQGWLNITDVPQENGTPIHEGLDRERRFDNVPIGRHYGKICYSSARPGNWKESDEILLHGYWTWDWNDSFQTIAQIDKDKKIVYLKPPYHNYGYTWNQRFRFLNILEELTVPGTWCYSRKDGALYLQPPADEDSGAYTAAVVRTPLIRMQNCSDLTIRGFTFAESLGAGVKASACRRIRIEGCNFTHLGDNAVEIEGRENTILSCDMHDLGAGGIILDGGDRKNLEPGGNLAENNHIYDFSKWVRTYKHGIKTNGVSNSIRHNLIHDAPQEAGYFTGNEHVFEYNEIHSVGSETGDVGAIHTGRDWTWRGTVLRYNYIHNLAAPSLPNYEYSYTEGRFLSMSNLSRYGSRP
ncbi:MAG: right-handed parallel beta-helix repeat-containing protein, partial [Spirochaetales bacterium]|nr:right-handed parallel beta-helix repeat-containing protein [Spirochaetales bacterium]